MVGNASQTKKDKKQKEPKIEAPAQHEDNGEEKRTSNPQTPKNK